MTMAAVTTMLKAKLMQKGVYRPAKMVSRKMPDGSALLGGLPTHGGTGGVCENVAEQTAADKEYCEKIDQVAAVFGGQKRAASTAQEHVMYTRIFGEWCVRSGMGAWVDVTVCEGMTMGAEKEVSVRAAVGPEGVKKIVPPQFIVGYLLEMAVGSKNTPKCGHSDDLFERMADEGVGACGLRAEMKRKEGTYGFGAFANEPWSLQAYQKRVYALRDFYRIELNGLRMDNPAWDDSVCGVLGALAQLVGKKAQHVPEALTPKQLAAMAGAADVKNPTLLMAAAYALKNGVNGNRAEQEVMLDWHEVSKHMNEGGAVDGLIAEEGQTKTDRLQIGRRRALRCASDCTGKLQFKEDGSIDGSAACPVHLLLYGKAIIEEELGLVPPMKIEEAVFADYKLWADAPRGATVVALSDTSPLMTREWKAKHPIMIVTKEKEKQGFRYRRGMRLPEVGGDGNTLVSPNAKGMWFEVANKPYLVRPWTSAADITTRLRTLAIIAQKQARKTGVAAPFGDAFKVTDLKGKLSSKSLRRMMATEHAKQKVPSSITMKEGGWTKESTMLKYVEDVDPFATAGINLSDVCLREKPVDACTDVASMSAALDLQVRLLAERDEEIATLRALLAQKGTVLPLAHTATALTTKTAAAANANAPLALTAVAPAADAKRTSAAVEAEAPKAPKKPRQRKSDEMLCCESVADDTPMDWEAIEAILAPLSLSIGAKPVQEALCCGGVHLRRSAADVVVRKRKRLSAKAAHVSMHATALEHGDAANGAGPQTPFAQPGRDLSYLRLNENQWKTAEALMRRRMADEPDVINKRVAYEAAIRSKSLVTMAARAMEREWLASPFDFYMPSVRLQAECDMARADYLRMQQVVRAKLSNVPLQEDAVTVYSEEDDDVLSEELELAPPHLLELNESEEDDDDTLSEELELAPPHVLQLNEEAFGMSVGGDVEAASQSSGVSLSAVSDALKAIKAIAARVVIDLCDDEEEQEGIDLCDDEEEQEGEQMEAVASGAPSHGAGGIDEPAAATAAAKPRADEVTGFDSSLAELKARLQGQLGLLRASDGLGAALPAAAQTAARQRGLEAAVAGWLPNAGQMAVLNEFFVPEGQKYLVVLGGPGTGKSTLLKAIARGILAMGEPSPVVMAEYNHQVIKLQKELKADGILVGMPQTRAGLYQMPNEGKPAAEEMVAAMKEEATRKIATATTKLEDEFALGAPRRLDACERADQLIRKSRLACGGLSCVKFGDAFQGNPILNEDDVDAIPGSTVAPRCTLAMEGDWFTSPLVKVMMLTEAERFRGEDVLIKCLYELSGGPCAVGKACERLRTIATAKVFDDDLYVPCALGSNWQVMTKSNEKALRRAVRRGATEANGQMVHHRDEVAIATYSTKELKCIRGTGFEDAVYVIGERYVVAVKEQDATATTQPLMHGKKYVTNMTGATLRATGFDASGNLTRLYVELDDHLPGAALVEVALTKVKAFCAETRKVVEAHVFPLKPFYERFVKLFQGLEFDEFEVDASHFQGEGQLLMAISRVRKLSGLKLKGCASLKQMRFKAALDWKVVHMMSRYMSLPPAGVAWASEFHRQWLDAWEQYERRGKRPRGDDAYDDGMARRARRM